MLSPLMLIFMLLPAFSHSVNINQLRPYVEAFLQDLEVTTDPPKIIHPTSADFEEATSKFVNDLLEELSTGPDALKIHPILIKMVELYSSISLSPKLPALSLPKALSFGAPCNPLNHFTVSPDLLTNPGILPEHFYPQLQDWLRKSSSPDFSLCDTHIGLICSPSESTCTCQPKTTWISPPDKCLLSPGSPCTFLNIHLQSTHFASIHSPSWFASRVLIFPVASPTCGAGLVCDSITEQTALTPSCICLEKSSRNGECKDKSTWAELESLEHKVSKLLLRLEDKCSPPPPEIQEIIKSLRENEGLSPAEKTDLKTRLVEKQFRICDFENHELCSEEEEVCLRNCPFEGQTHDSTYNCRINYAQRCSRVSEEYITAKANNNNPGECIKNSECLRVSTGLTEGQSALTCICSPTEGTKEFHIRNYWYGPKCKLNPKSFWLGLFKPFQSGKSGDEFIQQEMEIDSQLKLIEKHTILGNWAKCDYTKEPEVLKTLTYFGNNQKLDESSYAPLLEESLESVKLNDFCDFKRFLRCSKATSSCDTFDSRFILKPDNLRLYFAQGENCHDPLPPSIPKVFYSTDDGTPEEITCVSNSFCVIDLSQPNIKDFTRRTKPDGAICRCPRNATGAFCNETLRELAPYNSLEKTRLENLLKLIPLKSTLNFGELCLLEVEEPLESLNAKTTADTDLYKLFATLSPILVLKKDSPDFDDLDFQPGVGLCDTRERLRCSKVPTDPLSPSSSSTVATCNCIKGYERKRDECYISDGEPCGEPSHAGSSCASGKCSSYSLPSGETPQYCEEDVSHRYVVPRTSNNPKVTASNLMTILIFSSLPNLPSSLLPVVH